MYIYIYIYIYIYMYVCVYIYIYVHIYICRCICTCICIYIYIYTRVWHSHRTKWVIFSTAMLPEDISPELETASQRIFSPWGRSPKPAMFHPTYSGGLEHVGTCWNYHSHSLSKFFGAIFSSQSYIYIYWLCWHILMLFLTGKKSKKLRNPETLLGPPKPQKRPRLKDSDPVGPELLHEAQLVDRQIIAHLSDILRSKIVENHRKTIGTSWKLSLIYG